MLDYFEIHPMFVPTVAFYLPEKGKYGSLIGKFDFEPI